MLELLLDLMSSGTGPTGPTVTAVSVASTNAGACTVGIQIPHTNAAYEVTVTVANPDWTNYTLKLYENGVLVKTFTGTPLTYSKTMTGRIEGGVNAVAANKTYRADMVKNSTSQVVSTVTSAEWTTTYGVCPT